MEQNLPKPSPGELSEFKYLQLTLEQELEQIQQTEELHISFRDGRNLITVCEPDPAFREVIVEYYRSRIEQMQRWQGKEEQPVPGDWNLRESPNGIDPTMLGYQ